MKRSTLVALAVLVALVGLAYWLDRRESPGADRIFDVSEEDIERVEILTDADASVVIARRDDAFHLVEPVEAACDETEVDLVLSNLATMTAVRRLDRNESADVAAFGLDAPTLRVRFATDDGREHEIRFGKDTLTGSNQYAERRGTDEVLVVGNHVARNLGRSAWDLRDKAVFHVPDDAEPVRVTITRGDDIVELVAEDGGWFTGGRPRSRVDRFEVTGMVARFARSQMLDLPDDAAIETPWLRLDVALRGADGMRLEIGDQRHVDYLARVPERDRVFVIEGGLVAEIDKSVTGWWSRKLLHHATTEDTVAVVTTVDDERSFDREEARDLLSALSSAIVDEIVANPRPQDPDTVVTVTTGDARDEISFYQSDGAMYARRDDEDVVLRLRPQSWAAIRSAFDVDTP